MDHPLLQRIQARLGPQGAWVDGQGLTPAEFMELSHEMECLWNQREELKNLLGTTLHRVAPLDRSVLPVGLDKEHPQAIADFMVQQFLECESARRQMESREAHFRNVLESVKEVIFHVDLDGRFHYLNHAWTELTGYSVQESIGRLFTDFVPQGDARMLALHFQKLLDGEGARTNGECRCLTRDGGMRWVKLHVRPVISQVPGVSGTLFDITAQKRNEAAMLQTQKLESLGVLAGGIAHDFNNLLVSIMGNADLASRHILNPARASRHMEQVHIAIDRAAELCRQLLAYSGKGRFTIEAIHLSRLVRETTHLLKVSIGKSVALDFQLEDDLPPIDADPSQIRQAVMNLVINASEAIGNQEGTIRIETGLGHPDTDPKLCAYLPQDQPLEQSVYLRVQDSGCGMDSETLKRIFDPFFTTKFTGRGLGLAAILGITRSHNGSLFVESEVGHGTTFSLHFPVSKNPHWPVPASPPPEGPLRGSGQILVIEDDPNVQDIVVEALEVMGFTALRANNGQEGVDTFKAQSSNILAVLLDLTMPVMGGEEAFGLIQGIRPVPVILMSGYSEQEVLGLLATSGMAGFLQKPFKMLELSQTLKRVLAPATPAASQN